MGCTTVGDIVPPQLRNHDIRYNPGLTFPVQQHSAVQANLVGIFEMLAPGNAQVIWAALNTPR